MDAASRWGRPQPLHHFEHQSKHGNSGMLHSAARDIVISFLLIEKPEWKAVISFKASRPTAQGLCLSIGNNKKKETCLSEQVGLKATDFVWKAMFSFHAVELQGYRSTSNTEKDSITRAAQSSELNSVAQLRRGKKSQLSTNFSSSCKKKEKKKEKVHKRPKRCSVLYYKFIAGEYCETLQAGWTHWGELWRFSFIIPPQPSAAAYRSLVWDVNTFSHLRKWHKRTANMMQTRSKQ